MMTATRRSDTKSEILDIAERYWLRQGYNGFSYQHIAQDLGVKSAAIHYHFPAKGDLGVALVERMRRRFVRWAERTDAEIVGFWPRFDAFVAIYEAYLDDGKKLCPSGILDAEYHTIPEGMQEAAHGLTTAILRWLTRALRAGRDAGEVSFNGEPEGAAIVVGATLQGAVQIARSLGRDAFHTTVEHLKKLLHP
ncbi:MAG: TetR/AcrR family transcriptional regulator [Myxococcales bacterium]|nr:TetR/AcrR family transcriptional regulator [Myxococcales bacterium]